MPGYEAVTGGAQVSYGLRRLDHAVGNVHELIPQVEYMARTLGGWAAGGVGWGLEPRAGAGVGIVGPWGGGCMLATVSEPCMCGVPDVPVLWLLQGGTSLQSSRQTTWALWTAVSTQWWVDAVWRACLPVSEGSSDTLSCAGCAVLLLPPPPC